MILLQPLETSQTARRQQVLSRQSKAAALRACGRLQAVLMVLQDAKQGTWQRIEGALVDGLLDRAHLQLASEDLPDLLRREAVRPLRSRLEVARASFQWPAAGTSRPSQGTAAADLLTSLAFQM
jgi:hypothetical protein